MYNTSVELWQRYWNCWKSTLH